jgi:hypothetical protein
MTGVLAIRTARGEIAVPVPELRLAVPVREVEPAVVTTRPVHVHVVDHGLRRLREVGVGVPGDARAVDSAPEHGPALHVLLELLIEACLRDLLDDRGMRHGSDGWAVVPRVGRDHGAASRAALARCRQRGPLRRERRAGSGIAPDGRVAQVGLRATALGTELRRAAWRRRVSRASLRRCHPSPPSSGPRAPSSPRSTCRRRIASSRRRSPSSSGRSPSARGASRG